MSMSERRFFHSTTLTLPTLAHRAPPSPAQERARGRRAAAFGAEINSNFADDPTPEWTSDEILRLEMPLVDPGIERAAGRLLDQLGGREERAIAMDVGAQPGEQWCEITL